MSSYIKPQVLVFQEFRIVPTEITEPLRAHIAGPHAVLHRYSDLEEKKTILLGQYDRLNDVCYPWPQRQPGSIVDLSYVKVYADDALLKYFEHDLQSTYTRITHVTGKFNWIQSDDLSFKSNTAAYPRSSDAFFDRDVKAGDVAYLRTVVDQEGDCIEVDLWTEVVGFASDLVDSLIKPAEIDTNNQSTTTAYAGIPNPGMTDGQPTSNNNYLQVAGKENCVKLVEIDGSDYDGLASGDVTEEYTVQVIKSTISGCNAARLRIRSASGRDDVEEVVPNDLSANEWTLVGTRGLKVRFAVQENSDCIAAAAANDVAYDNFVTGQKWVVAVRQEFYAADADSAADGEYTVQQDGDIAGAYNGAKNDVYIVEVTKGGAFDAVTASTLGFPEVTVSTVKGLDRSGPTEVVENNGEIGIGTNGVKIKLSAGGPVKSIELETGGSTYTSTPTVVLSAPDAAGGVQATATCTLTGGVVSGITITNPGSGYYNPPSVSFTGGGGTGATAQAYLNVGLRKGDKFYVSVVSSKAGPVRKLILRDDLPSEMRDTYTRSTTVKASVRVVADENVTLSGLQTIDGETLEADDRVLLVGQTDAEENGIYVVGSSWTRATDFNQTSEIVKNVYVPVTSGDTYAGSGWVVVNAGTVVVDTSPIYFVRDDEANTERNVPLDLKLFIKDDIQVSRVRPETSGLTNYWFEETQVCVQEGVTAYHPEWTAAGVEQPLPVESAKVYVEYREWLADLADEVNSISDVADLDNIAGQLHPDNPLKWGVYKALSNSNGTVVKYTAVAHPEELDETGKVLGPDLDSWVQVLERIKGRDDLYNLVPMTFNRQIQNLWAAHIGGESNEIANNWKAGFFSLKAEPKQLVVGNGALIGGVLGNVMEEVLATLADDPNATGSQFTLLQVPAGTDNKKGYFITNDVRPGDIVRYNFSVDQYGEEQYEEYVVDQVLSENSLLLFTGADAAVTQPQRVEIYHNRNRNEIADDIAQQAGSLSNRRVCAVWPDQVGEGGTVQPGYYLAAALAGLVSGVVPHQPLTNVEVAGFDDFTRSYKYFNETQLNRMAEAGVWIVTEDRDGTPFSRHALTTDNLDLNRREEMIRRNVDSMSYLFLRRLRPFIGRTNVQPGMVRRLKFEVEAIINFLSNNGNTEELGSQLISGEIRKLQVHPLLKDRIEIVLDLVVPAPLNNIELHLVV
jgi:hypothetical protein